MSTLLMICLPPGGRLLYALLEHKCLLYQFKAPSCRIDFKHQSRSQMLISDVLSAIKLECALPAYVSHPRQPQQRHRGALSDGEMGSPHSPLQPIGWMWRNYMLYGRRQAGCLGLELQRSTHHLVSAGRALVHIEQSYGPFGSYQNGSTIFRDWHASYHMQRSDRLPQYGTAMIGAQIGYGHKRAAPIFSGQQYSHVSSNHVGLTTLWVCVCDAL